MIRPFLVLIFLFIIGFAHAQDALTGRVYEDKSTNAIPGVTIRNLKTNRVVTSDRTGGFMIPAQVGDLVVFVAMTYAPDTLYVKDLKYIEVRLIPKSRMLNEVKVTGSELKLGNLKDNRVISPIGNDALIYQTDANGNNKGGLAVNIFDSHSAAKKRQLNAKLAADEGTTEQVDKVFSPGNLQKYVPLEGQEMDNFIVLYRPNIEEFKSPEFNLTLYLNACYKKFMQLPADKRRSKHLTDIVPQDTTSHK